MTDTTISSATREWVISFNRPFTVIGERINPTGRELLAEEIAFLLQWDDPFKDVTHDEDAEFDPAEIGKVGAYNSYVNPNETVTRQLKTFRDSIAMQFPVKPLAGTKRPHFFRGDSSNPVNLWVWKSDLAEQNQPAAEEANARGWKQPPRIQDEDQQQVVTNAVWVDGTGNVEI